MKRIFIPALLLFALLITPALAAEGYIGDLLAAEHREYSQTTLGSAVADSLRFVTGAEVVVLPAEALTGNLRGGAVSAEEVRRAVREDVELVSATLTAQQLYTLLEEGLSRLTVTEEETLDRESSAHPLFPQVSGCTLRVNVTSFPGERIWELRLSDGTDLLRDSPVSVTVCTSARLLAILPVEGVPLDTDPVRALIAYAETGALEKGVDSGRIQILGTADDRLIDAVPPFAILILMAVVIFFSVAFVRLNGRPVHRRYGSR